MRGALQVGKHMIKATLDHEEIGPSPMSLEVIPGAPCLSASVLDEAALASAVAGQTCAARLSVCNAYGAPLGCGGAPLTAAVCVDGTFTLSSFLHSTLN